MNYMNAIHASLKKSVQDCAFDLQNSDSGSLIRCLQAISDLDAIETSASCALCACCITDRQYDTIRSWIQNARKRIADLHKSSLTLSARTPMNHYEQIRI